MRGPGESQLEMDRRMIGSKVRVLRERLERVQRQRTTQRRSRARGATLSVSLVGYTNAGKSTLFNAMTRADAYAADQLFATLDTTTRAASGSTNGADHAFRYRWIYPRFAAPDRSVSCHLEEAIHADLLLHVVDASSPQRDEQIAEVDKVLAEIGAADVPRILVYNKIDAVGLEPRVEHDAHGTICRLFLSAQQRSGLNGLREAIAQFAKRSDDNATPIQNLQSE